MKRKMNKVAGINLNAARFGDVPRGKAANDQ